jgi:hypothetical protein
MKVMSEDIQRRTEETHKAITRNFADMAKRYAGLAVDGPSWTTSSASGAAAYVFVYLQVDCNLAFPGGPSLTFNGKGLVAGLGATGSLGGAATFNVNPNTLKGMPNVTFEAAGLSIVGGGFQVTWYQNNSYIGHGEFYGLGISLGTPGGGWGSFS